MEKTDITSAGCSLGCSAATTRNKYSDLLTVAIVAAIIALFAISPAARDSFGSINRSHGMIMSFIKFAILATFGEVLALRLNEGVYLKPGFGLLPKAFVWGLLGIAIKTIFVIFAAGVPAFLSFLNLGGNSLTLSARILQAFSVSVLMNLVFAPVLMTLHKMSDIHIAMTGGTMGGLFSSVNCAVLLKKINWDVLWGFVFMRTIPFFWIPAHTITFLLPPEMQIGFAAILGVALGVILAFAGTKK